MYIIWYTIYLYIWRKAMPHKMESYGIIDQLFDILEQVQEWERNDVGIQREINSSNAYIYIICIYVCGHNQACSNLYLL